MRLVRLAFSPATRRLIKSLIRKAGSDLLFLTLVDARSSAVQVVVSGEDLIGRLRDVTMESVVLVRGTLREKRQIRRGKDDQGLARLEIDATEWRLLNPAVADLPFRPTSDAHVVSEIRVKSQEEDLADCLVQSSEDLRAEYRYLDLRRKALADNIRLRSRVTHIVRSYFHENSQSAGPSTRARLSL